jgi:hypothetical protein
MPNVGELRGIRIQVVGPNEQDETGLQFAYPLVPEEGTPAYWNGTEWVELIKGETNG